MIALLLFVLIGVFLAYLDKEAEGALAVFWVYYIGFGILILAWGAAFYAGTPVSEKFGFEKVDFQQPALHQKIIALDAEKSIYGSFNVIMGSGSGSIQSRNVYKFLAENGDGSYALKELDANNVSISFCDTLDAGIYSTHSYVCKPSKLVKVIFYPFAYRKGIYVKGADKFLIIVPLSAKIENYDVM